MSSPTDKFAGDPPVVPLTDGMERYYADNAFLLYPLLNETADMQKAFAYNGGAVKKNPAWRNELGGILFG